MKELDVNTLKKRIVKAIKSGNNETKYIIEACKAEIWYYNWCKAMYELQKEGIVVCNDLGYFLNTKK